MLKGVYSISDLVFGTFWLVLFFVFAFIIVKVKYRNSQLAKHFWWGLVLKFFGCVTFILIYTFYYGGGDTFRFYHNANTLIGTAIENPMLYADLVMENELDVEQIRAISKHGSVSAMGADTNYTVVRFASFFGLFSFGSYLASSLFFAFFSFIGVWCLYRTVTYIYPQSINLVAIPILYFPSVVFWGSSMMKDSIVIGFLGLVTYSVYQILFRRRFYFLIIAFVCLYFLKSTKEYVIIAYLPALFFWVMFSTIQNLKPIFRTLLKPFLLVLVLGGIIVALPLIGKVTEKYALEQVLATAEGTASYLSRVSEESGGSLYTIDIEYTPIGLAKAFPAGVIVSLYRPFIFEAKNPVMLVSAIEGTIVLFFTLFVIIRVGLFRLFARIFGDPFLFACLTFSILFAFAIGISTFNFGSLVRYKIPCLPFYGIALIIPYVQYMRERKNKKKLASS